MTYSVAMSSWILVWTNLSFAVCERLIAINMPNYYSVTHSLISGICNISPWVYYALLILLSWMGIFEHYIDFGCSNHLMYTPLEPTKMVIQLLTFSVLVIMLIVLIMSRLLHPVYADDALEVNRINLEMKTTFVVLKIAVINVLLFSPLILYSTVAYYNSSETISELKIKLVFYQLAVHANSIPFFVMLRRKEFRKAVAMIFASTASIRKARPMNLLLEVTEARRKKSSDVDADPSTFQGIGKVTAREDFKKIISSSPSIKQ
uniref:G-protein coupled receptors family 1 profile domain-containing protein n=1 Tax=Biomphalaria glabrata TaxID=6526 RepID=A0A2C9M9D8_BIOGL